MIVKKYPHADVSRMQNMFLSLGLAISLAMVTIVFNWKTYDEVSLVDIGIVKDEFEDIMDIPATVQPPPPPPVIQQPEIVAVSDEVEIEELELNLDIEISEDMTIAPTIIEDIVVNEGIEEEVAEEIFTIVEEKPSFMGGGNEAFLKWVGERLKYPDRAIRENIQGKVFIQFVVEKDGSLTDIVVLKGIGGGTDEEAVRLVSSAPKWSPGKQRGQPVRVRMVLPITFILRNQ